MTFLSIASPRTNGLYAVICLMNPGNDSNGRMVLLKNRHKLLMLMAAKMLVSSLLNRYPTIMPMNMKSVVKMSKSSPNVGSMGNKLFPKK